MGVRIAPLVALAFLASGQVRADHDMPPEVFSYLFLQGISKGDPDGMVTSPSATALVPVIDDGDIASDTVWANRIKTRGVEFTSSQIAGLTKKRAKAWKALFESMDGEWRDLNEKDRNSLINEAKRMPKEALDALTQFRSDLSADTPFVVPGNTAFVPNLLENHIKNMGVIMSHCSQTQMGEHAPPPSAPLRRDPGKKTGLQSFAGYEWNRGEKSSSTTYYPKHRIRYTKEGRPIDEGGPCSALGPPLNSLESWRDVEIPFPMKGEKLECDMPFSPELPPDYVSIAGRFTEKGSAMRFDFHEHPQINDWLQSVLKTRNENLARKQAVCDANPSAPNCKIIMAMKPAEFIPFRITDRGATDLFANGHFDICRSPDPNFNDLRLQNLSQKKGVRNHVNDIFNELGNVPLTPIWIAGPEEKKAWLKKLQQARIAWSKSRRQP